MPKKRVFVDTNVIFECFRVNAWSELTQRFQVETVEMCEQETLTGNPQKVGYIHVDPHLLRGGLYAIHPVSQHDIDQLVLEHEKMVELDDGEKHLFAYLFVNQVRLSDITVLCTADKGAVLRANDQPGWLDWLQSLQEVLQEAGVQRPKIEALKSHHTAAFLSRVRTDVRNGVLP